MKFFVPDVYKNIELALFRVYSFLFGVYSARYVYEGKQCRLWANLLIAGGFLLKAASLFLKSIGYEAVLNKRIVACLFAFSLLFVIAKVLDCFKWEGFHKAMCKVGAYSLELYMTHVTIRHLMNKVGIHTYRIKNYMFCIVLAVVLSVLLQKCITSMTNKHRYDKIN